MRLPEFPRQVTPTDCGYHCLLAVLHLCGIFASVEELKARIGDASRGLTVSQLMDGLAVYGVGTTLTPIQQWLSSESISLSIAHLRNNHFVAVLRSGGKYHIFDPAHGWDLWSTARLLGESSGCVVCVKHQLDGRNRPYKCGNIARSLAIGALLSSGGARVVALTFIFNLALLSVPVFTMYGVNAATYSGDRTTLGTAAVAFAVVSIVVAILGFANSLLMGRMRKRVNIAAAAALFDALSSKPLNWLEQRGHDYAIQQQAALGTVFNYYCDLMSRAVVIGVTLVGGAISLLVVSPLLLLPCIVSVLLISAIDLYTLGAHQRMAASAKDRQNAARRFQMELLSQMGTIKRFGVTSGVRRKLKLLARQASEASKEAARLTGVRSSAATVLQGVEQFAFFLLTGYFVQTYGLSLGAFVAIGLYRGLLVGGVTGLVNLFVQRAMVLPQLLQLEELLTKTQFKDTAFQGASDALLGMRDVQYRYGKLDAWALQVPSFIVRYGEVIGVSGPSGSGKTTLLKLLCGVLTPNEGVTYQGKRESDAVSVFSVLSVDRLFLGSIAANVTFFRKHITESNVRDALEFVGLMEFVDSLALGLDTPVGEGLAGISSGQRQRILIARAIVERPDVLIFDEATSNLDLNSESTLLKRLISTGMALVICSHRTSTLAHADRIYCVEAGIVRCQPIRARADETMHGELVM